MNNAFGVAGAFRIEFHAENENQSRHGGRLLDNRWLSTRRPHELHFRHFTAPQHHLDSYLFIPMSLFLLDTMRREEIKTFFFFYASRWNERCGDGSMVVGECVKIEIWDVSRLFFRDSSKSIGAIVSFMLLRWTRNRLADFSRTGESRGGIICDAKAFSQVDAPHSDFPLNYVEANEFAN